MSAKILTMRNVSREPDEPATVQTVGTGALAQPAEPIQAAPDVRRRIEAKEDHLSALMGFVRDYAMRSVHDWNEAFEMERKHLGEQIVEWMERQFEKGNEDGTYGDLIQGNYEYIAELNQAEAIYDAEIAEARAAMQQAHARIAARIENEIGLKSLAEYLRQDDPLAWLDWD